MHGMMRGAVIFVWGLMLAMVGTAQGQSVLLGVAFTGFDGPATLYTIDPATGAATPKGPIVGFERCSAMDFNNATGTLYAVCQRSADHLTWVLITIDPKTGAGTEIGLTAPVPATVSGDKGGVTDIAFCGPFGSLPAGTLFAADGAPNLQSLNTINIATGAGTFIAFNGSTSGGNAIACSPDGPLFHFNDDGGIIRWTEYNVLLDGSLDGSRRPLADVALPPGLPAGCFGRLNAADVDPAAATIPIGSGRLIYASLNCGLGGTGENFLVSLDIDTPPVVANIRGQTVNGLDALAFVPAIAIEEVPAFSCVGFDPPMASGPVTVKQNRVLPLKAQLFDEANVPVTDLSIVAAPVVQVVFNPVTGPAIDVSDQALAAGQGMEGNQCVFSDSRWRFNLKTTDYSAAGTYTITMVSGDTSEYTISPTCTAQFVID